MFSPPKRIRRTGKLIKDEGQGDHPSVAKCYCIWQKYIYQVLLILLFSSKIVTCSTQLTRPTYLARPTGRVHVQFLSFPPRASRAGGFSPSRTYSELVFRVPTSSPRTLVPLSAIFGADVLCCLRRPGTLGRCGETEELSQYCHW